MIDIQSDSVTSLKVVAHGIHPSSLSLSFFILYLSGTVEVKARRFRISDRKRCLVSSLLIDRH